MYRSIFIIMLFIVLGMGCNSIDNNARLTNTMELQQQVTAAEKAFAKTMADRDHQAFTSFISEEAVFISGNDVLRGRQQVANGWKVFFEKPDAPFSWEPRTIEVLDSGILALSSGPVYDAGGKLMAEFTSIWRLEAPATWRVIFDKGNKACE